MTPFDPMTLTAINQNGVDANQMLNGNSESDCQDYVVQQFTAFQNKNDGWTLTWGPWLDTTHKYFFPCDKHPTWGPGFKEWLLPGRYRPDFLFARTIPKVVPATTAPPGSDYVNDVLTPQFESILNISPSMEYLIWEIKRTWVDANGNGYRYCVSNDVVLGTSEFKVLSDDPDYKNVRLNRNYEIVQAPDLSALMTRAQVQADEYGKLLQGMVPSNSLIHVRAVVFVLTNKKDKTISEIQFSNTRLGLGLY